MKASALYRFLLVLLLMVGLPLIGYSQIDFSGSYHGGDFTDKSSYSLSVSQSGETLSGYFSDSFTGPPISEEVLAPGFAGPCRGSLTGSQGGQLTCNLVRGADGATDTATATLSASNNQAIAIWSWDGAILTRGAFAPLPTEREIIDPDTHLSDVLNAFDLNLKYSLPLPFSILEKVGAVMPLPMDCPPMEAYDGATSVPDGCMYDVEMSLVDIEEMLRSASDMILIGDPRVIIGARPDGRAEEGGLVASWKIPAATLASLGGLDFIRELTNPTADDCPNQANAIIPSQSSTCAFQGIDQDGDLIIGAVTTLIADQGWAIPSGCGLIGHSQMIPLAGECPLPFAYATRALTSLLNIDGFDFARVAEEIELTLGVVGIPR
jgi:hypothetical protein